MIQTVAESDVALPKIHDSFVIGGGIVGLIAGYLKGSVVISNSFEPRFYGPIWLHYHKSTERFLNMLGIEPEVATVKVLVYDGNEIREPTKNDKIQYSLKVWGDYQEHTMSEGKKLIKIFDYPIGELYKQLLDQVKTIIGEVVSIDPDLQLITVDTPYGVMTVEYSELISTIPLNVLCEILGIDDYDFVYKTIYGTFLPDYYFQFTIEDKQIVYDISQSPFYRHTKYSGGWLLSESVIGGDMTIGKKIKNKIGLKELDGIKLVGRYARWIPKYYIHDALQDLGVK